MKYTITNQTTNYSCDRVTFSAVLQITADDVAATDPPLWEKQVSVTQNISEDGWYGKLKQSIISQCKDIKDTYIAKMTKIAQDSGQPDVPSIIADITSAAVDALK